MNKLNNTEPKIKMAARKIPQGCTDCLGSSYEELLHKECLGITPPFTSRLNIRLVFTTISLGTGFPTRGLDRVRFLQRVSEKGKKSILTSTTNKLFDSRSLQC